MRSMRTCGCRGRNTGAGRAGRRSIAIRRRSAVNRFARERVQDVEYFLYLQWLAAEQLREAQATARELGMTIGLYGDVAVGANSAGSETWSNRHLYLPGRVRRRTARCAGAERTGLGHSAAGSERAARCSSTSRSSG